MHAPTQEAIRRAADQGKAMAVGWECYCADAFPLGTPPVVTRTCELAFYGGAFYLFTAIMSMLDSESGPTRDDLDRMSKINAELLDFILSR